MGLLNLKKRRRVFLAAPSAFTAAASAPEAVPAVMPKKAGEIKVVAMMAYDYWHNGVAQELNIRYIFTGKPDMRIIFVRSSRMFTPDLISDADLLITARTGTQDSIELYPDGLSDRADRGEILWTDENVDAIIDNIRNRGMGYMSLHNSLYNGNRRLTDFLGIEPIMHNEVQPIWIHDLNRNHPITRGIGKFYINLDEQFAVVLKDSAAETLFESTAMHDKRHAIGGWALERGKGRVVGLLPGHTQFPYRTVEYQEIVWRAAHWAMRRTIPPFPGAEGDYL